MSVESLIEWTDATWNPLLGCDKCSAGCALCYAIRTAFRLQHNPNPVIATAYEGLVEKRGDGSLNWTGKINLLPDRLREPMQWRKPRRIFVNSQRDLFHESVAFEFVDQVFAVMAICPRHTFQVLTKRPARMRRYFAEDRRQQIWRSLSRILPVERFRRPGAVLDEREETDFWDGPFEPLHNVWLGTSVENQKAADDRIPDLLGTPAAVRFLSCEPLLGKDFHDRCRHLNGRPSSTRSAWLQANDFYDPA